MLGTYKIGHLVYSYIVY